LALTIRQQQLLHPAFGLYWQSRFIAAKAFGLCRLRILFKHLQLLERATGHARRALRALIILSLLAGVVVVQTSAEAAGLVVLELAPYQYLREHPILLLLVLAALAGLVAAQITESLGLTQYFPQLHQQAAG
jgi:hypothetical protein